MSSSHHDTQKSLAELCVSAFIRIHCKASNIPSELIQLCLSMYFDLIDKWNAEIPKIAGYS